jgi:hypothetical protein
MDNDKAQKICKGVGQYRINVNQDVKLKRQSVFFRQKFNKVEKPKRREILEDGSNQCTE